MNYLFTYKKDNIIRYKILYDMSFEDALSLIKEISTDIIGVVEIFTKKDLKI